MSERLATAHSNHGLLRLEDLDVRIGQVQVCRDLCLSLEPGQCWALLGGNGVGKSTLLLSLAGIHAPIGGAIQLNGVELGAWRRRPLARHLGLLLQETQVSASATVMESVLCGRHPHLHALQWESAADMAIAASCLEQLGLAALAGRDVQTLSGGERRRLGIATLLAQAPQVLLLDEPTNHLDLRHQVQVLEMLRDIARRENRLVVMSLHDINLAARFCDHALLLFGDGECSHGPSKRMFEPGILSRLYGYPLQAARFDGRDYFLPG